MRHAFKEWAVVVDALGHGEQVLILRKGGISEGAGGFCVEQPRFLLFPTLFHQQRERVIPRAQQRYDAIASGLGDSQTVRLEFFADVIESHRLDSLARAERLRGQHIWRDEVVAERFDWGREKNIFALAVRVSRLPNAVELPMRPAYGGCKSWIDLEMDVDLSGGVAVLGAADFESKLRQFRSVLAPTDAVA